MRFDQTHHTGSGRCGRRQSHAVPRICRGSRAKEALANLYEKAPSSHPL